MDLRASEAEIGSWDLVIFTLPEPEVYDYDCCVMDGSFAQQRTNDTPKIMASGGYRYALRPAVDCVGKEIDDMKGRM